MKKLNALLIIFLFHGLLFSQQTITGIISDSDGQPLPGATIIVTGTTNGTTSDFDGNYQISVSHFYFIFSLTTISTGIF